ncbi:MAG: hypothetical protein U5K51_16605 [Flavobacteriaceae bacterium]|nr:hypothetical protein [Flavobacteriaceae bacterium]
MKWNNTGSSYSSTLSTAYLLENYDYYPDKRKPEFNENKGSNFI